MSYEEVKCKSCSHLYGAFRDRCPACGTRKPPTPNKFRNAPKMIVNVRRRRARDNDCIFCYKTGATEVCPHCKERIHKTCLTLHARMCEEFQRQQKEFEQSRCDHTWEEQPGEPPIDVCTSCGATRE
jgi:hypothetical protein